MLECNRKTKLMFFLTFSEGQHLVDKFVERGLSIYPIHGRDFRKTKLIDGSRLSETN